MLPCYNEESNLEQLFAKISQVCQGSDYKIVAVDDGSTDGTYSLLCSLSKTHPVVVLRHKENRGLHEALRSLLLWVCNDNGNPDYAITMDSDLTHDPKYIPELISACEEKGVDIAIASRFVETGRQVGVPFHRAFLSKWFRLFVGISLGTSLKDVSSGYRCIRSANIKELVETYGPKKLVETKGFEVQLELLFKLFTSGAKITEIPLILDYSKKKGKSKLRIRRAILGYFKTVLKLKSLQRVSKFTKYKCRD